MLSLSVARTRTHLSRVSTIASRTNAKNFYSTRSPPSKNANRFVAVVTVASVLGLWWITIVGDDHDHDDQPHLKIAPVKQFAVEPGLYNEHEVTHIISQEAYSFPVTNIAGVTRYDGTQLASNSPCEDRFLHGKFSSPWNDSSQQMMSWAVFDGHAGWQTADLLKDELLPSVQQSLNQIVNKPLTNNKAIMPEKSFQRAITQGFMNLDDSIIKSAVDVAQGTESLPEKVKKLAPAYAGSCALLSIYDSTTSTLHVACTGDSRAVLGQKGPDGKWAALPLSVDQTGSNEEEVARIYNEHPGEEDIVDNGRVLGLMVSRAFGDSRWKWPLEFQRDVKQRFYGPAPLTPKYDVQTPPYITAEPVVTSTKIDPTKPSFLIMATDGLWDMLSSQQGVDLVGKWLESQNDEKREDGEPTKYSSFDFGQFWEGVNWKFVGSRTTIQDDNAAVHLVRNALGGNHHELIAGRLAFGSPFSRRVRDDITVQVVFFGVPGLKTN
jgi:pyruvate dehydrogenase phosphatase